MPQQLIYTSAPRGLVAGRSGHCTVARSASMRDALTLQLEKLSYYQHLSLTGGQERPIYSCRVLDIRGSRFHVLSRIQDAGLDFTGRTNFLAHHLVVTPEEVRRLPSPPVVLHLWTGWVRSWAKEPQVFEREDWSTLTALGGVVSLPARTWDAVTGNAASGYALIEARAGVNFRVDDLSEEQILTLFAESLELLELRDPRKDFHATAWLHTFTTSMQEQDNPADFRWRCLHSDNPAYSRFAGPDCRPLSEMRAMRVTNEEGALAKSGRQVPRFVIQPQNVRITEGEPARLRAKAEGVPSPGYQWFSIDRAGNGQVLPNALDEELVIEGPPLGISRYVARASNSQGEVTSEVVSLSVEQKVRLSRSRTADEMRSPGRLSAPSYVKSADDIERQRNRIQAEQAEIAFKKRLRRKKFLTVCGVVLAVTVLGGLSWWISALKKHSRVTTARVIEMVEAQKSAVQKELRTNAGGERNDPADPPSPTPPALPDGITQPPRPWMSGPIGVIHAKTSALADGNGFIVNGSGENIYGKSDNFFFLHRVESNCLDFVTRLYKADKASSSPNGIMLRESEKPDAAFAFVGLSGRNVVWVHRDNSSTLCEHTSQAARPLPLFFRLLRANDLVSGGFSTNGLTWTWLGTNRVMLPAQHYLAGFAVCSGNRDKPAHAEFDEVTLTGGNQ